MAAEKPTPKGSLQEGKTTYMSWGSFDFELVGNQTFRPTLAAAKESKVVSNVKTYRSYSPDDSYEPMTIRVIYDPETWDALKEEKNNGTVQPLETSDGFNEPAMITQMGEVTGSVEDPITEMPITFGFPSVAEEEGD